MANNTIDNYKEQLDSDTFQLRNEAEKWFLNFIPNFNRSKLNNIYICKFNDENKDIGQASNQDNKA